ncbi:purine-nucleoside phosphorylase [Oceanirhabdus sp. W0125-5]|uniref:purine-nucleoside phosphorylase n=1 Tax=Oceanirhabdus sp. W0125-5 TaxID=2999116 RepID=UPI0022F2B554|nr:purine-nucleoside phosphorylase [Oceanirhabdus sp. W0125-5]WBW95307.1 purine-nucleoside phosphorylase [Oceanirhabdus sp. W0125-5]
MNYAKIKESAEYIKGVIKETPEIGAILGSGLGAMADNLEEKVIIKYEDVPNMPASTVHGHAGQFVFGKLNGKNVVCMQGRFHYYEGHAMERLGMPVNIMKELGVKVLMVTNAAGGVNTEYVPGDLMIIKDHINFASNNPLMGSNDDEIGPRFPDMSDAYDKDLREVVRECAKDIGVDIKEGVYTMMTGPAYETPAEIRMLRILGSDAVGMSTVPEVIAAKHCGLKVIGISCITNMAAGILEQPLNHEEVIETSAMVRKQFIQLVGEIIKRV